MLRVCKHVTAFTANRLSPYPILSDSIGVKCEKEQNTFCLREEYCRPTPIVRGKSRGVRNARFNFVAYFGPAVLHNCPLDVLIVPCDHREAMNIFGELMGSRTPLSMRTEKQRNQTAYLQKKNLVSCFPPRGTVAGTKHDEGGTFPDPNIPFGKQLQGEDKNHQKIYC